MSIRPPAVAGTFYDARPERLRAQLRALLDQAPAYAGPRPRALIVPHAGYVYSGAAAARAYRAIEPWASEFRRVVLYGPAHRVALEGLALPAAGAFATPLGEVPLDLAVLRDASALPGVVVSDEAHRHEHSLEVQLPFLQTVLPGFRLVPVVVGHCAAHDAGRVIDALWGDEHTLVVISTDLSHFHHYEDACRRDAATCARLLARDNTLDGRDACGAHALNGLMSSSHGRALAIEQLALCNSGDTAGDRNRVVGYGAFALH